MQAFEFHTPTKVVFGPKTEEQVGQLVRSLGGSRVLVVYGGGSAVRSGLLDRVTASLNEAGLAWTALGGVQPNPLLGKAREGVKLALEFG